MSSYPGASYLQGQPLPGPPPGPPPGPSRHGSHNSQYPPNSYGAPAAHQPGAGPTSAPGSAPQPFPQFQQQQDAHHLPTIHQHRPLSNSQMRAHSYSQPQQIPQGRYPPQQPFLHPQHASAPQQSWMPVAPGTPGSYTFGEPTYSMHPGMDPRRHSASSHHSGRSTASYHSGHSKGRKSRYSDDSGFSDEETWDSMYDSEEEERRRRKKERRKRREEEAEKSKSKRKRDRPTMGDSVFAVFDSFKDAFASSGGKH